MTLVGLGKLSLLGSGSDKGLTASRKSRARVEVEPATFCAVHWYHAASDDLAPAILKVEAPPSV